MKGTEARERKSPKCNFKKLLVYLVLTVVTALIATLADCRNNETQAFSTEVIVNFLIFLAYFAALYAIPLLTDGYHVILPVIATVLLTALLAGTTSVDMRMIRESGESGFFKSFSVATAVLVLLFLALLYTICSGLLTRDARRDGQPPIFHSMSRKGHAILYGILASVLLITGVTTSIIHHNQMTKLNAYAVSENDYLAVMPNLRAVADTTEPESVTHGLDYVEYAAIEGVDHHYFLYAKPYQWALYGHSEGLPLILRHKDNATDPATDAAITDMTVSGDLKVTMTPALTAEITDIVRGRGVTYRGEKEPSIHNTSGHNAHNLKVTVSFEGYDALVWQAPVVEFEGSYLLQVETATDFADKDAVFEHTYAYYELTELVLPEAGASEG